MININNNTTTNNTFFCDKYFHSATKTSRQYFRIKYLWMWMIFHQIFMFDRTVAVSEWYQFSLSENATECDHDFVTCLAVCSQSLLSPSFGSIFNSAIFHCADHVTSVDQSETLFNGCRPIRSRPCYSLLCLLSHTAIKE